jgi:hypothetical protein
MSGFEHVEYGRATNISGMRCHGHILVGAMICVCVIPRPVAADEPADSRIQARVRQTAISAIVDDRHILDSALRVHRLAATTSDEQRYDFLAEWVLPGNSHDTTRLALDFTTTQPAPIVLGALGEEAPWNDGQEVRVQTGGKLVSPALDLIETANALGRLRELRARIEGVESQGELQQRARLTMLALVDLAAGDHERAAAQLDELFSRVEAETYDAFHRRWPETLAVHGGLQHERTRDAAAEMLYRMLQSQVRTGAARGPDAWDRWVTSAVGWLDSLRSLSKTNDPVTPAPGAGSRSSWRPVSKMTAWSRGRGLSPAAWLHQPEMATNLASHTEDYLYYESPLRGDFEVECDVTSFHWRDSHLMVAGTYVAPSYDHVSYAIGSFRAPRPAGMIKPRLSECDEWIRIRTVVRGGTCSTYFNGRLIHTEPMPEEHDPWLAIRSMWYADGSVRDLRITGKPVVPECLRLTTTSDLTGWFAYFDEPVGGAADHWCRWGDATSGGGIIGRHEPLLRDQASERLLQYHRPMLEDGTIEYEFYYQPGESLVHPALDRRAWILDPSGVQIHWVTDGNFERNGLDPLNRIDEPEHRRGPSPLPLKPGAWNHLRLELIGNVVRLSLNDETVYSGPLESTNLRTFGLFYWSDQTDARVRNVVWRGDWPRELPPVQSQELADSGTRWLDERIPQLIARFDHDFARDGLLPQGFLPEKRMCLTVQPSHAGARVVVTADRGYTPGWIGPHLQIEGDFDVQAVFEQLDLSGSADSSITAFLMMVLSDPEVSHTGIYRGRIRKPNMTDRVVVQTEFNRTKPSGIIMDWPGSTAEESTSGTFRLARRGDKIYCLFSEADSPHFRLIHTEVIPRAPTRFDGLRLMASISSKADGPCEAAVTWKRLSIWAEKITPLPNKGSGSAPAPTHAPSGSVKDPER